MPDIIEGKLEPEQNNKFAVVVSKFNGFITEKLLEGCLKTLKEYGVKDRDIDVVKVPGAFEIPAIVKNILDIKKYSSVICLGAVIRGETPHFDYICSSVSNQIGSLSAISGMPVIFGIITCENLEQAQDRAGGKKGNKGSEAALAALEMVNLVSKVRLHNSCTV